MRSFSRPSSPPEPSRPLSPPEQLQYDLTESSSYLKSVAKIFKVFPHPECPYSRLLADPKGLYGENNRYKPLRIDVYDHIDPPNLSLTMHTSGGSGTPNDYNSAESNSVDCLGNFLLCKPSSVKTRFNGRVVGVVTGPKHVRPSPAPAPSRTNHPAHPKT